jgi:hypothetical protein
MSGRRKRVQFKIFERIRDHHDCPMYDDRYEYDPNLDEIVRRDGCLTAAADLNSPRVCWEGCPLWMPPAKNEHLIIAEILDNMQSNVLDEQDDG